jgi:NAD(P)-dependent dehydrogenase (short-subunit alcohol dehydrogenase family)
MGIEVMNIAAERGTRLAGRTTVVLGAGSVGEGWGNGRAISVLFARQGSRLVCVDSNPAALETTRKLIVEDGGEVLARVVDVTDEGALQGLVREAKSQFGSVDVLVNNVGGSRPGGPCELSPADWDQQFAINVRYVYLAMRAVLPLMQQQARGSIVNVSSIGAIRYPGSDAVGYVASKAALLQLSRSVAVQYAGHGIRSNCVIPGLIETPLVTDRLAYLAAAGQDMAEFKEARARRSPMGRTGDAWDVAFAALFLACDESRYITATELLVDGGLSATTR